MMATTAYCKTIASDSSATAPSEISTFDSFNSLTHGRLLSWDGFWKTPQELKLLFDLQDARELLGKAARACKPGDPEKETLVARAELARTTYELEWTRQCRECPEEGDVRFEEGRVIEELVVVEKEQIVVVEKDVREAAAIERDAAQLDVDMYRAIGELPDELDKVAQNVVVEASASFNTLEDSNIDVLARHEDLSSNQDDTEKVPKVLMAMLSAAAKADSAAVFDDESNDTACTATLTVVEVEAALKEIASAPEVTVDVHVSKDDFVRVPEMVDMDISNAITNNAKQVQEHDIVGLHMQEKSIEINANIVPVAVEVDVTFKQQEYGADGWQRVQHQHRSRKRRESKVSTSSSSSSSSSSTSIQESSSNSTLCELATLLCASSSTICGSAASLRGSSSTSSTSSHGSESCYTISRNSRCTNVPKMRVSKLAPVTNPWSSKRRQSTESTRNNQQYEPLDNTGCQEVRHQRSRKTTSTSPMVRDPVHHVNIEQIPLQRANMHCQQPHGIRLGSKSKLPQSFASIVTSRPPDPVKCRQYARNVVPLPRDASYAAIVGNVSR